MNTPSRGSPDPRPHKRPSKRMLTALTFLVGFATLGLGIAWLVYSWIVDREVPYFAIPLVLTVPVIVAVAFRNCWD
jgi:apolipoprotein N-acyltransferase